jgi:type II secretory pathway component GspD/PulD (secretin)
LLGLPRRMRVGDILQLLVAQFEEESTLLIRKNRVEITTKKAAGRDNLLKQTFVASFDQHPLEFILEDFADITGVSVIVDGRSKEKIRTPVTARFRNDVPLSDALRMVTESAELKLVFLPGGLFVTTPSHADLLEKNGTAQPGPAPPLKKGQ